MRYALRKQDKISSVYSEDYFKEHIISSLDYYFDNTSDKRITDEQGRLRKLGGGKAAKRKRI